MVKHHPCNVNFETNGEVYLVKVNGEYIKNKDGVFPQSYDDLNAAVQAFYDYMMQEVEL